MNYLRTAILLSGLMALFMGVGYLIGGSGGALIAFFVAAATNFFASRVLRVLRRRLLDNRRSSFRLRALRCSQEHQASWPPQMSTSHSAIAPTASSWGVAYRLVSHCRRWR